MVNYPGREYPARRALAQVKGQPLEGRRQARAQLHQFNLPALLQRLQIGHALGQFQPAQAIMPVTEQCLQAAQLAQLARPYRPVAGQQFGAVAHLLDQQTQTMPVI